MSTPLYNLTYVQFRIPLTQGVLSNSNSNINCRKHKNYNSTCKKNILQNIHSTCLSKLEKLLQKKYENINDTPTYDYDEAQT